MPVSAPQLCYVQVKCKKQWHTAESETAMDEKLSVVSCTG